MVEGWTDIVRMTTLVDTMEAQMLGIGRSLVNLAREDKIGSSSPNLSYEQSVL